MSDTNHINDGGPAFPILRSDQAGMTLRDWFAGQALAGDMVASDEGGCWSNAAHIEKLKERANFIWRMADAMIAARNNPPTKP